MRRFKGTATDVNGFVVNNNPKGPMNAAIYHQNSPAQTQPPQNLQSQQNVLPQSGYPNQNHSNVMAAPQPKMNNAYNNNNNMPHNRNNIPVVNNIVLANTATDDEYNTILDQMETHV